MESRSATLRWRSVRPSPSPAPSGPAVAAGRAGDAAAGQRRRQQHQLDARLVATVAQVPSGSSPNTPPSPSWCSSPDPPAPDSPSERHRADHREQAHLLVVAQRDRVGLGRRRRRPRRASARLRRLWRRCSARLGGEVAQARVVGQEEVGLLATARRGSSAPRGRRPGGRTARWSWWWRTPRCAAGGCRRPRTPCAPRRSTAASPRANAAILSEASGSSDTATTGPRPRGGAPAASAMSWACAWSDGDDQAAGLGVGAAQLHQPLVGLVEHGRQPLPLERQRGAQPLVGQLPGAARRRRWRRRPRRRARPTP